MYSRYPNYRFSGGVKIPDNYSGNAFKPSDAEEDMDVAESVGINESDTESEESLAVAERAEKAGDVAELNSTSEGCSRAVSALRSC